MRRRCGRELDARFEERAFERTPFFYRLLGGRTTEVLERESIAAGDPAARLPLRRRRRPQRVLPRRLRAAHSKPLDQLSGLVADETHEERVNRELIELLNELRVALPGVQVLFAFLLAVPFSQRFAEVTDLQRDAYMVALLLHARRLGLPDRRRPHTTASASATATRRRCS